MMKRQRHPSKKPPDNAAISGTAEPEIKRPCQHQGAAEISEEAAAAVESAPGPQQQHPTETSRRGDFNVVLPTLIQQLKSILDQYQDDGQILKEIIQNAEDASATTVKFLLDERSFESNKLHHPGLSIFQGPALYAYNDAVFKENDWKSLSTWTNSIKKDDPTKVGRFGLGFKSVFHMTDFPLIMSGDTVCAIDPLERYFTKNEERCSGHRWFIDADAKEINNKKDQFEPLRNVFDKNTGPFESKKKFDGTLFRFPLRQVGSRICDNIYNAEKVRTLFSSFQKAAEQMLVFLMSVERIELYMREPSGESPTLIFRVNVHPNIVPSIYKKRQEFLHCVKRFAPREAEVGDPHNSEASLLSVIILERFTQGVNTSDCIESSTYLVSHYCGWASVGVSNQLSAVGKKLSYLPWGSTAAMLSPSTETEPIDWMKLCPKPRGQLFCFLPLPLQSDSPTGLPVHVNGFFALSSSRHEVKWPSINDSGTSDDACQWNQYLLESIVPRAYANMVLTLIQKVSSSSPGSSDELGKTTRHIVYSLFPDPEAVVDRWKGMLSPFYEIILKQCVVFVHTENGGKWVTPKTTLIPDQDEEWQTRKATGICLAAAELPGVDGAASVPPHVLTAMQLYMSPPPSRLTPATLRTALGRAPHAVNMSDDNRLAILEFILKADDHCYQELFGVQFLPLMNGSFTSFEKDSDSTRVYVATNEHPQSLLPRSESLFVDLSDRITDPLRVMLRDVANSKKTNLRYFNEHYFKQLCRSMVTSADVVQCHYAKALWNYLHKYFAQSLREFEDLPFLLSRMESSSKGWKSYKLRRDIPLLTETCDEHQLNKDTQSALRHMGVEVVSSVESYILSHEAVRSCYVFPPSPIGILEVLCIAKNEGRLMPNNLSQLKAHERYALLKEIDLFHHSRQYTDTQVSLLKSLPLFEVKGQHGIYASASEINEAAPIPDHPSLPPNCRLLDVKASSEDLISVLGIRILKRTQLFERYLKPAILETSCSQEYIDHVMIEVLQNLKAYEQENSLFTGLLSSLPFVSRQDGERVAPSQVFDPHDAMLNDILFGQKLYPATPYDREINITALRQLGLVNIGSLTEKQLFECARSVTVLFEAKPLQHIKNIIRKSTGILKYLEEHSDRIGEETVQCLNKCKWLLPLTTPPEGYPSKLRWYGKNQGPVSPNTIYDIRYASIVGSCLAVLPHSVESSLLLRFKWNKPPPAEEILKHLRNAIQVFRLPEKDKFLPIVCKVYEILQTFNDAEFQESLESATDWIWHGEGFAQSRNMVLEGTDIDCKPHIYVVPHETQKYKSLFIRAGVHKEWNHTLMLDVLHMINERHTSVDSRLDKQTEIRDHQLSVKIVRKLAASWNSLPAEAKTRLIIPIAKEKLTLLPVEECTYSYSNRQNEMYSQSTSDEQSSIVFVHPDIDPALAEKLGVPSLSSRIIDSDDFEIGEGFGQAESLTTRLNRLLRDYADGLAVPKELIQNADDAGATEVQFVYDERSNTECREGLIDDGMRECQGPALWVYNNATFSNQDFQDIIRISNPEKATRSDRIGGFGLGFNAVYNLTDVPSFLSRESFVIFDPQKCHLGKSLPDSNQPGIKVNLQKNKKILRTFRNQFLPYDGICGCNIMSWLENDAHFNGTLFRLPLRTLYQASTSEISHKPYNKTEVTELFKIFAEACQTVLLFTQNVISVSVLHIPNGGDPREPRMLFKVTKRLIKVIRRLEQTASLSNAADLLSDEDRDLVTNANILRAAANAKVNYASNGQTLLPMNSMLVKIHVEKDAERCQSLSLSISAGSTTAWLVACCMGEGKSLKLAMDHQRLSPTGGVAAKVSVTDDGTLIQPIKLLNDGEELLGQIFCYLPLPIQSQLPVHINGAFALHSSRRALTTAFGEDKSNTHALWNRYLMEDVIAKAYIILLEDFRNLLSSYDVSKMETDMTHTHSSYFYYDLWPIQGRASSDCESLVNSFYCTLADTTASLRLFSDGYQWACLSKSFMLASDMSSKPVIAKAAETALRTFINEQYPSEGIIVIDLPQEIRDGFVKIAGDCLLEQQTYGIVKFFSNILTIISRLPDDVRDTLILYALDSVSQNEELKKLLTEKSGTKCIPVTPCGKTLERINLLVNPKLRIACLYSPDDGRFPFGTDETYLDDRRLVTLAKLGMLSNDLTDEELAACALRSLTMYDPDDKHAQTSACLRASTLLNIIEEHLENKSQSLSNIKSALCSAPFLPYISSKSRPTFKWKGDTMINGLLSPSELYLPVHRNLLCYVEPLLDEDSLNIRGFSKAKKFLEMDRKVPLATVLLQLDFVTKNRQKLLDGCFKETKKIMSSIYQFLQDNLEEAVIELNGTEKVLYIMVDHSFVHPQKVCEESLDSLFAPYLYPLPHELRKFRTLFNRLGMKDTFTATDIASALAEINDEHKDSVLGARLVKVAVNMANFLSQKLQLTEKSSFNTPLYLPDTNTKLRLASDLSFDNCPWLNRGQSNKDLYIVHESITYNVAIKLGVKTIRENTVQRYHYGEPFGQKEELLNRIKRIMDAYPCSKEIFYELIQNADDAGATEIHFIKDYRCHPDKKVFEDSWKPLQGPSLCVFNNKPFTQRDLEGIRSLGMGSKSKDPFKTGQYGVGFNSVYHLTDVPSFLTIVKDLGEVLCVMDPHCLYVPGATNNNPGRLYKGIDELRMTFPDMFTCYLQNLMNINEGTLFRFPLRTQQMANQSKLCRKELTKRELDDLLNEFKNEMFEVLLFVNNLTKIQISEVSHDGTSIKNTFTVQATLSKEDALRRNEFREYVYKCSEGLKSQKLRLRDIDMRQICYSVVLKDSTSHKEIWRVVHRIGFKNDYEIDTSIEKSFASEDLCLLPRGGAAGLISPASPISQPDKKRRLYCFLPLPLTTELPVHLNGHFALDYESRRGIWLVHEGGGSRTEWNYALSEEVVAPAYIELLNDMRDQIKADFLKNKDKSLSRLERALDAYFQQYPRVPKECNDIWSRISRALYKKIHEDQDELLPLLKRDKKSNIVKDLQWLPLITDVHKNATFFDDTLDKDQEKIKDLLIQAGLRWIYDPMNLGRHFVACDIKVLRLTPENVINFIRSKDCELSKRLPCALSDTIFIKESAVVEVAKYCLKNPEAFWTKADGLPLGLSEQKNLHAFSSTEPLFISEYHDLLPPMGDRFLHKAVRNTLGWIPKAGDSTVSHDLSSARKILFSESTNKEPVVIPEIIKKFSVSDLEASLHLVLECGQYRRQDGDPVKWDYQSHRLPNAAWLSRLWEYIYAQHDVNKGKHRDLNETYYSKMLHQMIECLSKWTLIPAVKNTTGAPHRSFNLRTVNSERTHYLVSIQNRKAVVDFTATDATDATVSYKPVQEALDALGVLKTDDEVWGNNYKGQSLVKQLTTNLKNHADVLESVHFALRYTAGNLKKLVRKEHCRTLLTYFSTGLPFKNSVTASSTQKDLRRLPFYETHKGDLIALNDVKCAILQDTIPDADFDVWSGSLPVPLLKNYCMPKVLACFLECQYWDVDKVYFEFIFQQKIFSKFSANGREIHLKYVRDTWLPRARDFLGNMQRTTLLAHLKALAFLDKGDGILQTASCFYDPTNLLLSTFWNADRFPSAEYQLPEWLHFLRTIGLRQHPVYRDFIDLAHNIASQSKSLGTEKLKIYASLLIKELFQSESLDETLLQQMRTIRFICASDVTPVLKKLHVPQDLGLSEDILIAFDGSVSFNEDSITCSWSAAKFLPDWADPSLGNWNFIYDKSVYNDDDAYRNFLLQKLGILKVPSETHIAQHIKNLVQQLPDTASHEVSRLERVMKVIYTELTKRIPLYNPRMFKNMPCILLKDKKGNPTFVHPNQLVLNMTLQWQVQPYIMKAPDSLASFSELLAYLGAAKESSVELYALFLKKIHDKYGGLKLTSDDVTAAHQAVYCLIRHMLSTEEKLTLQTMYLPSSNDCLYSSKDLVCNDYTPFAERLGSFSFNEPFLVDLNKCRLTRAEFEDAICKVPEDMRPRLLFKIVEENLLEESGSEVVSDRPEPLQTMLQSEHFREGLWRLIWQGYIDRGNKPGDADRHKLETALRGIEVRRNQKLVTFLTYKGRRIEGSERETNCFVHRVKNGTEQERYVIYAEGSGPLSMMIYIRVAEIIDKMLDGLLRRWLLYVYPMLQCNPSDIENLLDQLRITNRGSKKYLLLHQSPQ